MARENKLLTAETAEKELQNVQVYPSTVRIEINDKLSKVIFKKKHDSADEYGILERKSTKGKKKAVITKYKITDTDGGLTVDLTEFDRAVLSACISEQKAGNLYTTINIIFRSLIGKVGQANEGLYPTKNQRNAIKKSIKKLMGAIVDFENLGETLKELGYITDSKDGIIEASSILPATLMNCRINGQFVKDVLYFHIESPLLSLSERKNQILRYPVELLDVPNQNNTPLIIALKTYVLRRITKIKAHKMSPTITFENVFAKCGIEGVNWDKKFDCRKAILELFENLKTKNFINEYEVIKRGNSIHSVKFSF